MENKLKILPFPQYDAASQRGSTSQILQEYRVNIYL